MSNQNTDTAELLRAIIERPSLVAHIGAKIGTNRHRVEERLSDALSTVELYAAEEAVSRVCSRTAPANAAAARVTHHPGAETMSTDNNATLAAAIDEGIATAITAARTRVTHHLDTSRTLPSIEVAAAELRRAALAEAEIEGLLAARRIARHIARTLSAKKLAER